MKTKKISVTALTVIAFILELLPYGAVLNFANPEEGETIRRTYSYFSLTPYGYANFGPFLTALLTCVLLVLTVINLIKNIKPVNTAVKIIAALATLTSLMPLMFGINSYSLTGACISVALLGITVISFIKTE